MTDTEQQTNAQATVTRGSNMFGSFLKDFLGGFLVMMGVLGMMVSGIFLLLAVVNEDSSVLIPSILMILAFAAVVYGAFLQYVSRQTVMIAGTQTTTEKK